MSSGHGKKQKKRETANRKVAILNEVPSEEPSKIAPEYENRRFTAKDTHYVYKPPDSALALWGVLLGVVVASIYFMQWLAMNQSMMIDQRAWLSVGSMKSVTKFAVGEPFTVGVALRNVGNTPDHNDQSGLLHQAEC